MQGQYTCGRVGSLIEGATMKRVLFCLSLTCIATGAAASSEQLNFLSPEIMKALGQIEILSQNIKEDAYNPSILVEIKNNSLHHFQMLEIACSIEKNGKLVDKAQAYFMNVAPGVKASEEALYLLSKDTLGADNAVCRASLGM